MVIALIIVSFICVLLLTQIISYRRQVKKICRHVSFIKENLTNMQLYKTTPYGEMQELVDEVNEVLIKVKQSEVEHIRAEKRFKETITNLSHDIRTPLTSLDGYIQLMNEAKTDEEREQYMAVVRNRITNLKNMLEELFTFTKLQNDNYEFEMSKLDYSKLVFDTTLSFYNDFKEKNIEPEIEFDEEKVSVMGNEGAVTRVLQNIIKNALTHGTKKLKLRMWQQDGKVHFTCANGVENPEEIDIDMVFTRFYKADVARSKKSSGLGLAIAKGFVERMKGDIKASLVDDEFSIEVVFDTI